jgi:hypothetical protein|eukprot:gene9730-9542_t
MLTEIEWWGGVLFIVGAVVYRMAIGALDKDAGFDANRLLSHVFFLAPAVVLAGYFYPLERPGLRYAYLGVLAVALLAMVTTLGMEIWDNVQTAKEAKAKAAGTGQGIASAVQDAPETRMLEPAALASMQASQGTQGQGDGSEGDSEDDDEEVGTFYTVLGMLLLYSPVFVACALGCYKAWPMVQSLLQR